MRAKPHWRWFCEATSLAQIPARRRLRAGLCSSDAPLETRLLLSAQVTASLASPSSDAKLTGSEATPLNVAQSSRPSSARTATAITLPKPASRTVMLREALATSGSLQTAAAASTFPSVSSALNPATPPADLEWASGIPGSSEPVEGIPNSSTALGSTPAAALTFPGNVVIPIAASNSVPSEDGLRSPTEPLVVSLSPAISPSTLPDAIGSAQSQGLIDSPVTDFSAIWAAFWDTDSV